MAQIAWIDLAQLLKDNGFKPGQPLVNGLAVIGGESDRDPSKDNTQGNTPPSRDRGLWMINDYWHPEVSDECAFDAACATKEAFRISKGGTDYTPWAAFNNGSYATPKNMAPALVANDAISRLAKKDQQIASLNATITLLKNQIDSSALLISDKTDQINTLNATVVDLRHQIELLTQDEGDLKDQLQKLTDVAAQLKSRAEAAEGAMERAKDNLMVLHEAEFTAVFGS